MTRKRLAVIGRPIAHSRSPAMHNAAFAELGMAGEWSYEAIEIAPEGFEELTRALPGEGFVGANVTVPHKPAALRIADHASTAATEIGAANTLSFVGGTIQADNTDAPAFLATLPGPVAGKRALVLGAGGSARAIVWALLAEGARVDVWNRTAARADELADRLGARALHVDGTLPAAQFDLLVNATAVGLPGGPGSGERDAGLKALRLDADSIHAKQVVVDLVYGAAETELVTAARRAGATVVDGLEILVHQGGRSFTIWTGLDPPLETMRRAAHTAPDPSPPR